ncbi:MAG: HAD family hydrolase [[Clostridium] symbiosum]
MLYVGDSTVDAKTAENAKIDFAAVLTGATTAAELEQFSHVCIAEDLYGVYQFACR